MIQNIGMVCNGRSIDFKMDFDPDSISDASIVWYLQQGKLPEPEVIHLMMRAIRDGDLVVDAGANVGFFTLLLARLVGNGHVAAIEPGVNNLPALKRNLQINQINPFNVGILECPLAAITTKINFYLYQDGGANACWAFDDAAQPQELETVTLDELFAISTPRLIKLDIEGSEDQALRGAEKLLNRGIPFVVCEFNVEALRRMNSTPELIWKWMVSFGYNMFALNPEGNFPAHIPFGAKLNISRVNTNVLFSNMDFVRQAWPEVVL